MTQANEKKELTIELSKKRLDMTYQDTSLWNNTLGREDKNVEPLRESFLDARKNAEFLLDKIRKDFPNLTVHDITHVDTLWNVADTIIGEGYPINPLEGYVLGIAFLIHDAALSYETVGGKDALRETVEWKDAFADGSCEKDLEEFKKDCDFVAIRALHARKAEDILKEVFRRDNGTTFYILDDDVYRTHFGDLIGKIAASHHWNIDDVESKLKKQINPMNGMPKEWMINAQKLACILRCADAGHIDNGRAPDSIYRSLEVNGVSRQHWESQNHLCQVCEDADDKNKLCITSSYPFEKEDFSAWNVAYDAIRLFDEELKKSNDLLKRSTPKNSKDLSFPHKGISGAESKEALATHIETDGWQPCSFGVHTSNVKALIENLGGSKLYGEDNLLLVALRELIQNARDAIQARRTMDGRPEEGRITIRFKEEKGKRWIEVEDDGIGMSLDCIKNHLLDFGSSYWKSRLAKDENPGLRSKGFNSIGKFGIGFYSVFMVAKSVEVVTRRYNKGVDDAKRIEFPEGLTLSPILSRYDDDLSSNVSTIVKFELKENVGLEYGLGDYLEFILPLFRALQIVAAGLDIDVFFERKGQQPLLCHQNVKSSRFDKEEWLKGLLIHYPDSSVNLNEMASRLDAIKDEKGVIIGWLLSPEWVIKYYGPYMLDEMLPCVQTIGGLSASTTDLTGNYNYAHYGYLGYVDGTGNTISRNEMVMNGSRKICLQKWAKEKYRENYHEMLSPQHPTFPFALAEFYQRLIGFCNLENEIIQENARLYYSYYESNKKKIKIGSINCFAEIYCYLFVGVYKIDHSYALGLWNNKMLDDSTITTELKMNQLLWKEDPLYTIRDAKELIQICKIEISSYGNIIEKFCRLLWYNLISRKEMALKIWVNLALDDLFHKMIDWEKLDEEQFEELLGNKRVDLVGEYLEQFLIKTSVYLGKTCVL